MSLWLWWQERGASLAGQRDDVAWASDGAFGPDMKDWGLSGGKVGSWLWALLTPDDLLAPCSLQGEGTSLFSTSPGTGLAGLVDGVKP